MKIGDETATYRDRVDALDNQLALCQSGVAQALGFENLLAFQQGHGIISESLDKRSAQGELVKTCS